MSTQRITTHLVSVTLLLLWGGVMMYFYFSGRISSYLPPDGVFRPMALTAGIGLIALAILNLATMGAQDADSVVEDEHEHHHEAGKSCCGHDHREIKESAPGGRMLAVLILSLPLIVAAAMTPDRFSMAAIVNKGLYSSNYTSNNVAPPSRLSSSKAAAATSGAPAPRATPPSSVSATLATTPDAGPRVPGSAAPATSSVVVTTLPPGSPSGAPPAAGSTPPGPGGAAPAAPAAAGKSYGTFSLEDLKSQVPMSKEGNFILEVPELYYTAGDKEVQSVLTGQSVETTAQVLPEKVNNADGKRLRVFRMLVQCCAADARPYSVPVEFAEKAPVMKDMTWVKVIGKMGYRQEGGQTVPIIEAKSITETTAPDNSMLY